MENGQIKISKDVIAIITDLAVSESVTPDEVGRRVKNKGITVTFDDNDLVLGVELCIRYGKKIPEIAEKVQKKVKASVETMTGLNVKAVNITVTALNFEKSTKEE